MTDDIDRAIYLIGRLHGQYLGHLLGHKPDSEENAKTINDLVEVTLDGLERATSSRRSDASTPR